MKVRVFVVAITMCFAIALVSSIIRWTTTNLGGTDLHYGIVHYGANAKSLSEVAKSPNRRHPSHPEMNFRARIAGLNPQTTYYYTVEIHRLDGSETMASPVP